MSLNNGFRNGFRDPWMDLTIPRLPDAVFITLRVRSSWLVRRSEVCGGASGLRTTRIPRIRIGIRPHRDYSLVLPAYTVYSVPSFYFDPTIRIPPLLFPPISIYESCIKGNNCINFLPFQFRGNRFNYFANRCARNSFPFESSI